MSEPMKTRDPSLDIKWPTVVWEVPPPGRWLNETWQHPEPGESGSDFCRRLGIGGGDVIEKLRGIDGRSEDGRHLRLLVERLRVVALDSPPPSSPDSACDVETEYVKADGSVGHRAWTNLVISGFRPYRDGVARDDSTVGWPGRKWGT
jgi:hypothetical protein